MKKYPKFVLAGATVGALVLGYTAPASASSRGPAGSSLLSATTNGAASATATGVTPGFYTVSYSGEVGPAIKSITYDLSGDVQTFTPLSGPSYDASSIFNFDPNNFGFAGPVIDGASEVNGSGVTVDKSYTSTDHAPNPEKQPNILTFNFDPGTFTVNHAFSFGAGAEWVNGHMGGSSSGGDFGAARIPLTVSFYGGAIAPITASFAQQSTDLSSLSVQAPASVPLPGAVWLFGSGLVGLAGLARRRKAA